ncbi:16S rRNA (uracil(1498)-N(3))-methyltransferase [Propionivibrio sp.]|uniref:16S rRNA (uracil(1498)-N(3))-methyltransferase n=2 Tax=Propionivibrio sp. TaxID=2212460 RepID=UPI0025EBD7A3|nr:16S rRNA (uracil(1498)-N(3))-methyltransferase [Propionivibrio sp.]MBK7357223.1 16S rRNA (uracil(1498)-N(3))-methyltransferase [Propionivibrio sp.]MBK8401383.1 16S rRNA (uracil(1498)-N(3))-methyltransferase [Propionivibrio sp.]MBK8745755.1 16S rRNA (uracil(1498)-N(3))-methyltransferase [Propionivibrio sp.]MBK8892610.1 16S rRNA (uracil(1498)-N(3))-methyltransferase [Propionivibrio sp.]MBL0208052.1 16S rRNA (uracil(1498)-N(3))-methyltransferase [Propionivibrio sp.]
MRMNRFYCPLPLENTSQLALPEAAARHASRVLRLREGDDLILFDGHGGEYVARIARIERAQVVVNVLEWRDAECEAPIRVSLVQGLQAGEKMDMTIQKAVELGVSRIVPVKSQRSVVRLERERSARRVEHWRAVAIAACEQCGRNRVPEVDALMDLVQWLDKPGGEEIMRLMLVPGSEHTLDSIAPVAPRGQIELLIGPEGGLAMEELKKAEQAGFLPIRLGPRILRTETAGLAALAAIQGLWGDFREGLHHV